jgi:hypothetical protein
MDGQTARPIAACHGYKEILEKLWFWAREQQTDLQYDLLLVKNQDVINFVKEGDKRTVFHLTVHDILGYTGRLRNG